MAAIDEAGLSALLRLGQGSRRYAAEALPAYRYLPGLTPHPLTHPEGHSHGRKDPPAEPLPPSAWDRCQPYLFGCDLYNRAYWWEAHEAWEALWQVTRAAEQQHRFLQGLIQAANAQLKLALGKARAVERLWGKAESHWQAAGDPERFMGLELRSWRLRCAGYLGQRLALRPLRHDPAAYPLLYLQHYADRAVAERQNKHYSAHEIRKGTGQ